MIPKDPKPTWHRHTAHGQRGWRRKARATGFWKPGIGDDQSSKGQICIWLLSSPSSTIAGQSARDHNLRIKATNCFLAPNSVPSNFLILLKRACRCTKKISPRQSTFGVVCLCVTPVVSQAKSRFPRPNGLNLLCAPMFFVPAVSLLVPSTGIGGLRCWSASVSTLPETGPEDCERRRGHPAPRGVRVPLVADVALVAVCNLRAHLSTT